MLKSMGRFQYAYNKASVVNGLKTYPKYRKAGIRTNRMLCDFNVSCTKLNTNIKVVIKGGNQKS